MLKANDAIRKLFAYRHDILKAMIADGARLVVLGRLEKLSDLPEFRESRSLAGFEEVRYLDYDPKLKLMVVPEENVLALPSDPFAGEGLVVGLFARGLYRVTATRPVDPDFDRRPQKQQYELRVRRLDVEFDRKLQKALRRRPRPAGCGRARRRPATGSSTGPRASRRTSTPRARRTRPTAPTGRSPLARP